MTRQLRHFGAAGLVIAVLSTPLRAQDFIVYDPWSYYEDVMQVIQLVHQWEQMLRQARRLPVDLASRYRGHSVEWVLHDLQRLLYAQPIVNALNQGDPTAAAYRRLVSPLDVPTDILGRMPSALRPRLTTAYATLELADRVTERGVDQAGATRAIGELVLQTIKNMEQDAVSTNDDFHTQTALLNKINGASVLGLRLADQANQLQLSALEELIVDNTRKRDTEAALMDATIYQWRYGRAYGQDLFRNTAADLDTWRLR